MFETKRPRVMVLCMMHHLGDLYKFYAQDPPGIITGSALVLRNFYIAICYAIIRKLCV